MIKVLELFGGIGACSKALERLGIPYEIADYVEIDKYAVKSFNAIHGTNFEPQDITEWNKDIQVDLIMHGSPCQDFSLAGLQAGGDEGSGTRSSLMYETIRIVDKLRPKYVIWENVKNVISKKHKHNWDKYVSRMKELGYTSYGKVMNAKNYGIPQNRERVFTISIRDDLDQTFTFPEPKPLKLKLKDMLEEDVDEKYYLSDKMINCFMSDGTGKYPRRERFLSNINKENKDVANTIITTEGNKPTCNFVKDKRNMKEELCDELIEKGKVKENDMIRHSYTTWRKEKEFHTENSQNNNISATLTTRPDTLGVTVKNKTKEIIKLGTYYTWENNQGDINTQCNRACDPEKTSLTIPTIPGHAKVIQNDLRIRKLTPKECWRLMGFDDEDFDKASQVNSNAQLYKQAGNSIVVNVLEEIINNLIKEGNK